jgi:hypothetical protein
MVMMMMMGWGYKGIGYGMGIQGYAEDMDMRGLCGMRDEDMKQRYTI